MSAVRISRFRLALFGLLAAFALTLAPSAFARSHVGVSIGFAGPGYSVGYSSCRHCGWGGYGYGYGGYYGGYYAPSVSYTYAAPYYGYSYGPSYYESSYYGPSYYGPSNYRPSYGVVYHDRAPVHRRSTVREVRYYDDRGYARDRHDGYRERGRYYDRGRW